MSQNNKRRSYVSTFKFYSVLIFLGFLLFISTWFYLNVIQIKATRIVSKDLRYVLLWTRDDYYPFYVLGNGQSAFIKNDCRVVNCYVTSDRTLFNGDITKFDVIAFNGRNIHGLTDRNLPNKRSPHQRYIYFNLESAINQPVCEDIYDNFFNWTATYRLDSDIPFPYILIKNAAGEIVGPKMNTKWLSKTTINRKKYEKMYIKVKRKKKAAAWFVSNCEGSRMIFAKSLQKSLKGYNLKLDIHGDCGPYKCHRGNPLCDTMLEHDYYFYLALENSHSKDYVSEKVLTALNHFTVPIVYGGANYSKFLPPFSYIDGNKMSPQNISTLIHRLISSSRLYLEYMWWKDHYSFHNNQEKGICAVCAALNDETMLEKHSVYKDFRKWWNPQFERDCSKSVVQIPMKKLSLKRNIQNVLADSERILRRFRIH